MSSGIAAMALIACLIAGAQTTYQPKFKGDPAKSESEAAALGYMRTVLRAQKQYKKKNDKFAGFTGRPGTHRIIHQAHGKPEPRRLLRRLQAK